MASAWSQPAVVAAAITGLVTLFVFAAGSLLNQRSRVNRDRRDRYAAAYRDLVAWSELPYRICRRTSDSPEMLAELAGRFHDLQEQLTWHSTWVSSDSADVGRYYETAVLAVKAATAPSIEEAWRAQPVGSPAEMMVGDLGVRVDEELAFGRAAIATPFGWRRLDLLRRIHLDEQRARLAARARAHLARTCLD